jgi:formate hydrogenlyase subunit 4
MMGHIAGDVLIHLAKVFILVLILALIDVVNPRLRIDQAVRYYLCLGFVSLSAIVLALAGV